MFHLTAVIEDATILATQRQRKEDENGPDQLDVLIADNLTGKTERRVWTVNQLTAVLALAMGIGEERLINDQAVDQLYEIARPAVADFAKEVVPIP